LLDFVFFSFPHPAVSDTAKKLQKYVTAPVEWGGSGKRTARPRLDEVEWSRLTTATTIMTMTMLNLIQPLMPRCGRNH
jgi:hypothetical protein